MTIPRRSMQWARISTFSSSALVSQGSEPRATCFGSGQKRPSPSSKRVTRLGAPGTFFAIRAFARTRICRHSAMRFVPGTIQRRSPTARRFCAISPKPRERTASTAGSVLATKLCGRRGGRRTLDGASTSTVPAAKSSSTRVIFSSYARATTNTRKATRRAGRAWRDSPAASCIRRRGPKTCVTTASGSW